MNLGHQRRGQQRVLADVSTYIEENGIRRDMRLDKLDQVVL